jgi:hypothetical protein
MKRTAGCTLLDHGKNVQTSEVLKEDTVEKKLAQYKQNWLNHISKMEDVRYPKQLLDY